MQADDAPPVGRGTSASVAVTGFQVHPPALNRDLRAMERQEMSRREFERRWPVDHAAHWQAQQQEMGLFLEDALNIACLLAYYGLDYPTNLQRLLDPYGPADHMVPARPALEGRESLHRLPARLALLYRKRRDPALLHRLLHLRLAERSLQEAQMEALSGLWDRHRTPLLRAAGSSQEAQRALAQALIHMCGTVDEPCLWRACYRHLQAAVYQRERRLGWTARRLSARLRRAEQRRNGE